MTASLRIGIVNDVGQLGGIERMLLLLARELPHEDFKVVYFAPQDGPMIDLMRSAQAEVIPVLSPHWWSTSFYFRGRKWLNPLALVYDVWSLIGYINRLSRAFRAAHIDIVHSSGMMAQLAAGAGAKRTGIPHVAHVQDIISLNWVRHLYTSALARLSDQIVAISTTVSEGYPPDKTVVIHNVVDINRLQNTRDIRETLGISTKQKLIGMVGRLTPWKGQKVFLAAAQQLAEQNDQYRFILVGDDAVGRVPGYREELKRLSNRGVLQGRVQLVGHREDVLDIMAACDVLVHASTKPEPFGIVIVEAMAMAKPVIATAIGGPLDIIEDKIDGLLVPPGDVSAVAEAIQWLIDNTELAARMGQHAQEKSRNQFSAAHLIKEFIKIYRELAR